MHDDLLFLSLFDHSRSPRSLSTPVCRTDVIRGYLRPRGISADPTWQDAIRGLRKGQDGRGGATLRGEGGSLRSRGRRREPSFFSTPRLLAYSTTLFLTDSPTHYWSA